jgi:murein DD-endopeptidase MepM/ murein hydrolase activator NlpD
LDHGKRRAHRLIEAEQIHLGNEPPLSVDGENSNLIDRRRVSVQWFSGTILTGLFGAALMGGAVFASLDGETNFATVPEKVALALRGPTGSERAGSARKSDRLPSAGESNYQRQTIRVSNTARVGNREVVRVRPLVRVAGNLSMVVSELSANIPPFNPQRMLAESAAPGLVAADDSPGDDAEVSFVTRDLAGVLPRAKIAAVIPVDEVMVRVRETANWIAANAPQQTAGLQPTVKMAYAADSAPDPYAGFESRIAPANITLLAKTTPPMRDERTIPVKKGDSASAILRDLGGRPEEIRAITAALGARGRDGALKDGQKLRVLLTPTSDGRRVQPVRVVVAGDGGVEAAVAMTDLGKYVGVDVRSHDTVVTAAKDDEEDDGKGVRLYQSIYETALRNQVPRAIIEDIVRIYSYDVDFQRKVQPGDSFEILFAGEEESGAEAKTEVLFASLTIGGDTRKYYRFQTADDNVVDYYDESGKSAKKFLVRKPLADGIMRSGFGARHHPLLRFTKMHTGVDWAAPMGTPIYAAGNGVIEKMGWEGGYGKYVRLRHTNGYETAYGHMSAFARNLEEGKRVRQGQVIGYVGSTGLSTGAHLHYEILVNGRFLDPMRIRLPRGRVLEGTLLTGFEQERDRLDKTMNRAPTQPARVAQTSR